MSSQLSSVNCESLSGRTPERNRAKDLRYWWNCGILQENTRGCLF